MTTAPTAPAPTTNVHIVIPGFTALFEGAVNWSACGPVANEVAVAALTGRAPTVANAQAAVARDTAASRFKNPGGQTLSDIAWDLTKRGIQKMDVLPYDATPDLITLHSRIKAAAIARLPTIIEVGKAYNLPDNEAGVYYHFVVIGGIDSTLGYLIANGDTKTFISTRQTLMSASQMRWASWDTLVAAGICGAITLHPNPVPAPAPTPTPTPVVAPTVAATIPAPDYAAEIAAIQAQVAAMASASAAQTAAIATAVQQAQAGQQAASQALNSVASLRASLHGV